MVLALCGCDKLFSLAALPDAPGIDASTPLGCSDLTREGFGIVEDYPNIAACAGAWGVGGLRPAPSPTCGRAAGNTGSDPMGTTCTAADLCAEGWHVCSSRQDVRDHLPVTIATCADVQAGPSMFFATAQAGPGAATCDDTGADDVFGCGTYGYGVTADCGPLTRFSGNNCSGLATAGGWTCSNPEVLNIKKTDPLAGGGVLCCQN
jgi:hypothetical protein